MNLETLKDYHIDGLHLNKRQLIEYQCFLYDDYCLQVTTTLTIYIYIYIGLAGANQQPLQ
jgi:hypothetical protein